MHKNACLYASLVMIRSHLIHIICESLKNYTEFFHTKMYNMNNQNHNQVNCNKFIFFVFGVGARHMFVSVINICMFKTITLLIIQTTNS